MRTSLGFGGVAVVGGVLFLTGYAIVAGKKVYDDQVPGINLAILGVVVSGLAALLVLMSGRRVVTTRRESMLAALVIRSDLSERPGDGTDHVPSHIFVGGPQLMHYHRSSCVMAVGRDWTRTPLDRFEHERAGRIPCGVCKP